MVEKVPGFTGLNQVGTNSEVDHQHDVKLKVIQGQIDQKKDDELGRSTNYGQGCKPVSSDRVQSISTEVRLSSLVGVPALRVSDGLDMQASLQLDGGQYEDLDGQPAPPSGQF